ncbi:DUF1176 domain-containing protein [Erwinia sp. JUb26]|uniref:DUF1176 domain-containing protein n=1 Tax=Erwinia sp. JUb26 TaxID=2485126 RepID=UPI000FC3BC0B|nr:DUF1176 domain-containing protein [Erwinia sp. JUb26]ROR03454.1 uncharacterized protein DUF1176 [Erwinia sp. JUb26]
MFKKALMIAAVLMPAVSSAAQTAATPDAPLQKVFRNWQVTCNNLNDCDIRNLDEGLRIIVERKAGPDGSVELKFQGFGNDSPEGIWLDGKRWPTDITFSKASDDDFNVASSSRLATIQQWIKASKNARELSLSPQGDAASLSGLNAALLLVDERQGRLQNQTALLRVGNNEPAMVPPRPAPPALNFDVPKVVKLDNAEALIDGAIKTHASLLEKESCESDAENRDRSEAQPLNDKQALVLVNCGLGAYQSSSMLFISDRTDPTRSVSLTLPLPLPGENDQPETLSWFTEAEYDPETATLFFSGRGRGIADCGHSGSWKFDGKTFHLASYNSQPSCNGGEPGDWPSVWETAGSDR